MNIGKKIKSLRKHQNKTLKEVSTVAGISISYLSDIENERKNPSLDTLDKISNALGVSADEFLKGSPPNTKSQSSKPELNKKDLRDISKDVESIIEKLSNGEDGPTYYNDIEMREEDKELFRSALELALKTIKIKNKETYTPKKYRK